MHTLKKIGFLLIFLTVIGFFAFRPGSPEGSPGGFLTNQTTNAVLDTVNSASSNDTSYTFYNADNYTNLWIDYKQNSATGCFKVDYPSPGSIRLRYLASDSTICIEQKSQTAVGWTRLPLLTNTSLTPVQTVGMTLRTGALIFAVRGKND